jgi:UDP-N-acetylglucosamine 3-dehydrogenase
MTKILQVGLGNFGKRHLAAWHQLEQAHNLWIAETDERKWAEARRFSFPGDRLVGSMDAALDGVDVVDIATPTTSHFDLCRRALLAGKDVFVEKPMTMTSAESMELARVAADTGRILQVGYYYRYHPISEWLRREIDHGRLGRIRYVNGNFMGFKRARTDVGVMHTDGIHFLDLFNWLLGEVPTDIYGICRDHFGRGLEDFAIAVLTYPSGTVGKVEAGYIQPGRWKDKVVPGALTTKEITVVGDARTVEVDFETESVVLHDVHHELRDEVWAAVVGPATQVQLEPCDPVQMVARELKAFLTAVGDRRPSGPGPVDAGVSLAAAIEAIYESSRVNAPVRLQAAVAR